MYVCIYLMYISINERVGASEVFVGDIIRVADGYPGKQSEVSAVPKT